MSDAELTGKVAIVTGGAGGLGTAICHTLAAAGARIAVLDVAGARAESTARALCSQGAEAMAAAMDLTRKDSVDQAVSGVLEAWGGIDILINNAGVDVTLPLGELSVEDWDRVLGVNLRGAFLMSQSVLSSMQSRGAGHIVNIVSTAGKRAWPNASVYHASKWGLLGLSHALHAELRLQQIKVTAIIAGGMTTPFLLDRFPEIDVTTLQDPSAVAETVRFALCQPEGSVIPEMMVLPMRETSWP